MMQRGEKFKAREYKYIYQKSKIENRGLHEMRRTLYVLSPAISAKEHAREHIDARSCSENYHSDALSDL